MAAQRVSQHAAVVPYSIFQTAPSQHVQNARSLALPWDIQICMWSWCRFRAGLIQLRGSNGRTSRARFQPCTFCKRLVRNAVVHCLSACAVWNTYRGRFCDSAGVDTNAHSKDEFARLVLSCVPGQPAFPVAAQWFDQVDRSSSEV